MREMKDSGVEWIGKIPKNWIVAKFKYYVLLYTGNSIKDNEKNNYTDSINARPYIATKDINAILNTVNYNNGLFIKNDDDTFKIAPINSTLMCIEGGSAGKKKARIDRAVSFVNKLCCFYSNIINNGYLYYFISSPNYETEFINNITGLIGGVSVSTLKNLQILLPQKEEQYIIANYLDDKCSKIDIVIEKQQTLIEKLKEYKMSLITEVVTKGLNPDVETKDSGVEWICKIPKHWNMRKIKYVFYIKKDIAGKENYDVLSITKKGIKIKDITNNEGQLAANYINYQLVEIGDFAMNHMDLITGWVDVSQFLGVTSPDYRVFNFISNKGYDRMYYLNLMQMCYMNKIFYGLGQGVSNLGRWRLQRDKFLNFTVLVPPLKEQQEIANFLDKKCTAIENLIKKKQDIINKLTVYKKSLIYEVVTGKKEIN